LGLWELQSLVDAILLFSFTTPNSYTKYANAKYPLESRICMGYNAKTN